MYLQLKKAIERASGFRIYRRNTPWGLDLFNDLRRLGIYPRLKMIFDVGANVGQTALRFRSAVPRATIHSFEPVQATFEEFKKNIGGASNLFAHQLALGSQAEARDIFVCANSELASFHETDHSAAVRTGVAERVGVVRLDEFCQQNGIARIDLLKIDTEGHDLEVLRGADGLFSHARIGAVLVEAVFSPSANKVTLAEFGCFLEPLQFGCVGVYDQEWWGHPRLHYGNILFVRRDLLC